MEEMTMPTLLLDQDSLDSLRRLEDNMKTLVDVMQTMCAASIIVAQYVQQLEEQRLAKLQYGPR